MPAIATKAPTPSATATATVTPPADKATPAPTKARPAAEDMPTTKPAKSAQGLDTPGAEVRKVLKCPLQ
ncbi:MAG TPA: hypothetical protein ENF23_05535 [Methanosarcinales archaeon]|nr:hypothetical protein [Methanosarcinales archaeon]